MPDVRFGISTHLFEDALLTRDHLVHIAAHEFECVELVTTRSHFDYRNDAAIGELAEWLSDTRLTLHSVHAPAIEALRGRTALGWLSNASGDEARRRAAVQETLSVLELARRVPFNYLVVHLGVPTVAAAPGDNQRDAARRSAEAIIAAATDVGVKVAFEVIQNPLSGVETLVHMIEEDLDGLNASICLDYGHGHLTGDLAEVIESVAGHLSTTHLHDNDGRRDAHLMPYAGTIDWDSAITETQKIGYDGVLMFEVAESGAAAKVLARAAKARDRLVKSFVVF